MREIDVAHEWTQLDKRSASFIEIDSESWAGWSLWYTTQLVLHRDNIFYIMHD